MKFGHLLSRLSIGTLFFGITYSSQEVIEPAPVNSSIEENLLNKSHKDGEKFEFQAEVSRLLNFFAEQVYLEDDAFIREDLANACDAIAKVREELMRKATDAESLNEERFKVVVKADKEHGILTISDNGIGMTKNELMEYLGTIAKSGTSKFALNKSEMKDSDISNFIGQFGVGFYSNLLVASQVAVVSKNDNDPKQWIWETNATGSYSVMEDPRGVTMKRGTQVILKLKPSASRFLDDGELEKVIKKYFEHDQNAIYLVKHLEKEVPIEETEESSDKKPEDAKDKEKDVEVDEAEPLKKDEAEKKTKKVAYEEEVLLSQSQKPIYKRDPKDVKPEEYVAFFKSLTKETSDPLTHIHIKAEGVSSVDFTAILYIPKRPPFSALGSTKENQNHIKLHVRGVFVTNKLDDFLPKYLRFVKGIINSNDLPLNISRDMLQNNEGLRGVQKRVINKVFEMMEKLSEDSKLYKEFYEAYVSHLKLEIIENERYRTKLAKLLRFPSSTSSGELVSLESYVSRLSEDDKKKKVIYFIAGPSVSEVEKSPFLEKLREKGKEVLFLTDPVDEHTIQALREYEDFKFQSIAKEGLKIDEDETEDIKKLEEEFKPLTEWIAKTLSKDVEKVTISTRLTKSPCAIVASEYGWTGNMERVIMAQSNSKDDPMMSFFAMQKKILEINPKNSLIKELLVRVKSENVDKELKYIVKALYDSTLIWSGYTIKDSKVFAKTIDKLVRKVVGIPMDEADIKAEVEREKEEKELEEKEKEKASITLNEDGEYDDGMIKISGVKPAGEDSGKAEDKEAKDNTGEDSAKANAKDEKDKKTSEDSSKPEEKEEL